jgi:zinc transport system substrate-binding protein
MRVVVFPLLIAASFAAATAPEVTAVATAMPEQKPLIITTIKPLAIIAKSAVGDSAEVEYLQSAVQSAHEVSLPVSALLKIERADLIIWIGGGFEARISKPMALLPKTKLITVVDTEFLSAEPGAGEEAAIEKHYGESSSVKQPEKQPEKHHSNHHHHNHDLQFDPHIWLNPANGNILANTIQKRLGLSVAPIISSATVKQLKNQLKPFKDKSYLNHHDAFAHFVKAFDLNAGLSIRDASGASQGAKSQYRLRQQAQSLDASCIFIEPQYADKDARVIARELELPLKILDPQGFGQPLTADGYSEFMAGLVSQFKACFE